MRQIPDLPHPGSSLVIQAGNALVMAREWYGKLSDIIRALQHRVSVTGTATFAAATSVAVTFTTAEASTDYSVAIEAVANRTYWVTSKATTGFTINASASNSDTVGWMLFRR